MILILAVIFVVLLIAIGGDRGVVSLLALLGNILVLLVSVVAMTGGINPILVTLLGGILINSITLVYQNGRNQKTLAALISVGVVMMVLLIAVFIISSRMHIDGLNEIELRSDFGTYYSFSIHVNMHQVCISMIILGLLGAIMDTAVAVSSAVYEVRENNPHLGRDQLYHSGLTIGKDILATTLNTLYFAYIGEALMLLLYLQKYNYSLISMLNSKSFLQDFTCIIFSAIGCLIMIPLSSFISSHIFSLASAS